MPHDDLYNYIHNLDTVIINRFPVLRVATESKVVEKLQLNMFSVVYKCPCEGFDKDYILNLHVRFRFFSTLKFLNKNLISKRFLKTENRLHYNIYNFFFIIIF